MQIDSREDTISSIASHYKVLPDKVRRQYKEHNSGFREWTQREHSEDYMLFPENLGEFLSIDEVSLSQGELYTFITNKKGRGKKGSLVASIKGTRAKDIIEVLEMMPLESRKNVKEVTLDMAKNMELAVLKAFARAELVTDRFHVVKLVLDSLQNLRVKYRWEELEKENAVIKTHRSKKAKKKYKPVLLNNGDTPKQLLARCRYILSKKKSDWTESQNSRAKLLFERYPLLEKGYNHVIEFRSIYEHKTEASARNLLLNWIDKTDNLGIDEFNTCSNTILYNLENILNFFNHRNTNANAESFNSKIKLFRANLRGVTDTSFFLFRLNKLFA